MAQKKPTERAGNSRPKKWRPPKPELFDWKKFDPSVVQGTYADSLAKNLVAYRDHLDELLHDEGKYVLIVEGEIIGIYAEEKEAQREAIARFGAQPVLIKQIAAKERYHYLGGAAY